MGPRGTERRRKNRPIEVRCERILPPRMPAHEALPMRFRSRLLELHQSASCLPTCLQSRSTISSAFANVHPFFTVHQGVTLFQHFQMRSRFTLPKIYPHPAVILKTSKNPLHTIREKNITHRFSFVSSLFSGMAGKT